MICSGGGRGERRWTSVPGAGPGGAARGSRCDERARRRAGQGAAGEAVVRRRWVTATLVLASMIYSIDWTIAAVALPHMQGTFSATQDQVSWVLTSYIVASAVMLPATGWLAARLGRKRLFLVAVGGFTAFSLFCGTAGSLPAEVLLRIRRAPAGRS